MAKKSTTLQDIVNKCEEYIEFNRSIHVSFFLREKLQLKENLDLIKRVRIRLLENNKYKESEEKDSHGLKRIVFNPDYDLHESVKKTNKHLRLTNSLALGIAALTGVFIAMQFFKDDAINLQQTNKLLEQIKQSQDSMQKSQKGIDSSLRIMAKDSFLKHP